jgi:hypothetical protein
MRHIAQPEKNPRQLDRLGGFLLAAAVLGIGLVALNPFPVGVLHDDAVYVILAKALATGHGYRYLNLPGEPFATHFPPGYPLFLAALWRLAPDFPRNVFVFKCANAVLLVAGYLALSVLLRKRCGCSTWASRGLAFVAVAGVPMLFVSTLVLSETLFFAIAAIALVITEPAIELPLDRRALIVATLVSSSAALVRTPGIALIGAPIILLLIRRQPRAAGLVAAVAALLLAPWQLWTQAHAHQVPDALQGAYGSYSAWLGDAVRQRGPAFLVRTLEVTGRQAIDVVAAAVATFSSSAVNLVSLIALIPILVAGLRSAWQRVPVFAVFLVLYFPLVLIWPSTPARYIWGVWPFATIVVALGLRSLIAARVDSPLLNAGRIALITLAALPLIGYGLYNVRGYRQRTWLAIPSQGGAMLRPLVIGIRDHTPPNAVVASTAEAAVYLYTGRRTVPMYSFTVDEVFRPASVVTQTSALEQILESYPVDLIVGSTELQHAALRRLGPALAGGLVAVDSFPGSVVYRCSECEHAR